mmetsp:Transcript_11695/g.23511  ORF Transcript_11695/g.23511 Transcript_11695/m.23511 type:complete len:222 (-) Transcript_11695:53-718(-)
MGMDRTGEPPHKALHHQVRHLFDRRRVLGDPNQGQVPPRQAQRVDPREPPGEADRHGGAQARDPRRLQGQRRVARARVQLPELRARRAPLGLRAPAEAGGARLRAHVLPRQRVPQGARGGAQARRVLAERGRGVPGPHRGARRRRRRRRRRRGHAADRRGGHVRPAGEREERAGPEGWRGGGVQAHVRQARDHAVPREDGVTWPTHHRVYPSIYLYIHIWI